MPEIGGTLETTKQALERLKDEIKARAVKVKPGKAQGATSHGDVCAAGFGASALGRAQRQAQYWEGRKAEKVFKETKGKIGTATQKQRDFATSLGVTLKKGCSKSKAAALIESCLAKRKNAKAKKRELLKTKGRTK